MDTNLALKATIREKGKTANDIKRPVAAVLYGKDVENKSLWIDYQSFRKVYEEAGESTIINLEIEGNGGPRQVLIYDVQNDPISGDYHHVDFFQVKMDEEISAEVEITFIGESAAVKERGGVLVKNMDSIEVRCLPMDLPKEITADLAQIKTFDDYLYVKDLKIPAKVEVDLDPETVVALVSPPRSQEELEKLEEKVEADISQVEGIKKDEKAEEGEKK